MKKYLSILLLLFLCSCTYSFEQDNLECNKQNCAKIYIPTSNSYLIQIVNYSANFRVELIGYESYCYSYLPADMRFAVITPYFRVTRLRPSKDTEVDFSFYTQTKKGPPEFLGKRSYFASVDISGDSVDVKGKPVKVRVPLQSNGFEVELGLALSKAEKDYNSYNPDIYFAREENYSQVSQKTSGCGCGK